jgi:hypothetical protein
MTDIDIRTPVLFFKTPVHAILGNKSVPSTGQMGNRRAYTLAIKSPAAQYQLQKKIHNSVCVSSSLYSMNVGALHSYQRPDTNGQYVQQSGNAYYVPPNIYWNQMSDRARQANQSFSSSRPSTRARPGALSPGGKGVDIKHASYERYLNKLKGKGPLRRGPVPITYGTPVPFTQAKPVYGGKTVKTGIVNRCDCSQTDVQQSDNAIYNRITNTLRHQILGTPS